MVKKEVHKYKFKKLNSGYIQSKLTINTMGIHSQTLMIYYDIYIYIYYQNNEAIKYPPPKKKNINKCQ